MDNLSAFSLSVRNLKTDVSKNSQIHGNMRNSNSKNKNRAGSSPTLNKPISVVEITENLINLNVEGDDGASGTSTPDVFVSKTAAIKFQSHNPTVKRRAQFRTNGRNAAFLNPGLMPTKKVTNLDGPTVPGTPMTRDERINLLSGNSQFHGLPVTVIFNPGDIAITRLHVLIARSYYGIAG